VGNIVPYPEARYGWYYLPMTTHHPLLLTSLLASALAVPSDSLARETKLVDSVQITGLRTGLAAYRPVYDRLTIIRDAGNGRVEAVARVVSAKTRAPVTDVEVTLVGNRTQQALDIAADGVLAVPLNPAAYADNADLMSNKKKGELILHITLVPKLPKNALRYGDLADSIEAVGRVLRESVPWHRRVLSRGIGKIGICFHDQGQMVQVSGEQAPRPASVAYKDGLTGESLHCAAFAGDEDGIARDSVIAPPAGWQPVFL
jgi:hypothetical protein